MLLIRNRVALFDYYFKLKQSNLPYGAKFSNKSPIVIDITNLWWYKYLNFYSISV